MYKPDKTHPASSSFSAVEMKITQMAPLKEVTPPEEPGVGIYTMKKFQYPSCEACRVSKVTPALEDLVLGKT